MVYYKRLDDVECVLTTHNTQLGNIAKGDFVSVGNYISQENEILSSRLSTIFSQTQMGADLMRVFAGEGGTEEMLHGLRDVLLKADMGTEASDEVIEEVRAVAKAAEGKVKPEEVRRLEGDGLDDLRVIDILIHPYPFSSPAPPPPPPPGLSAHRPSPLPADLYLDIPLPLHLPSLLHLPRHPHRPPRDGQQRHGQDDNDRQAL